MFQHSNISSLTSDFRDVGFYGGKCILEVQNLNVYIKLYWMSQFHWRKGSLIYELPFKETDSWRKCAQ